MKDIKPILLQIKKSITAFEPDAEIILYGSYALGQQKEDSDIDILIVLNKDEIPYSYKKKISFSLHYIGLKENILISPFIVSENKWKKKLSITPFYKSIKEDGIIL